MALKTLLLRSRLEAGRKKLKELREKDQEFQKRESEIEAAISEMTEDTPDDDRKEIEKQAEDFETEKKGHEEEKGNLEQEIEKIENEIRDEEKRSKKAAEPEKREEVRTRMENRTRFFGMSMQERDAFFEREDVKSFLNEVRTCIREKRAITNAGLTIPEVMLELLKQKAEETSKLISRVSKRPVAGTARQRIMGAIPEAIWTEMCAKLNEMDLSFNDTEVDGYKVGGFFSIHNAILEDNDVNLASEIINALGKSIGKALDKAVVYGKGTKMPLGFVTRLAQKTEPENYLQTARAWKDLSTTNVITGAGKTGMDLFKEIVTNTGVIENDYSESGLAWLMNKKTHMKLMVQSMDKNMNAAIVAGIGTQMPIVGGDIVELNFIPDDNIAFGYLDMYLLAERAGTALGQSEHVRFLEDQTVFKGTARYDGMPVIAEAFGLMSITATAPKTTADFPEDKANKTGTEEAKG